MKMTVQKTETFTVDFTNERKRINKCFKGKKDSKNKQMLHELMNLIEQEKWVEAKKELEGKWWQGDDETTECSRLEFIGPYPPLQQGYKSFIDLVYAFEKCPSSYKVIRKTK